MDSIQRLLALPDDTLLYLCHDYPPKGGREHITTGLCDELKNYATFMSNKGRQKQNLYECVNQRDKTLVMPRLIFAISTS